MASGEGGLLDQQPAYFAGKSLLTLGLLVHPSRLQRDIRRHRSRVGRPDFACIRSFARWKVWAFAALPLRRTKIWACRRGCVRLFGCSQAVPVGVSVRQPAPESHTQTSTLMRRRTSKEFGPHLYRVNVLRSEAPKQPYLAMTTASSRFLNRKWIER